MAKYKNISPVEVTVAGIGIVKPGEEVEINEDTATLVDLKNFNNANFKLISKTSSKPKSKVDEEEEEDKK